MALIFNQFTFQINSDTNSVYDFDDLDAFDEFSIYKSGKMYVVNREIYFTLGSLNLKNDVGYFSQRVFADASSTGAINLGEKLLDANGNPYGVNGCTIILDNTADYQGYAIDQAGTIQENASFNLYGCHIISFGNGIANTLCVSEAIDCTFTEMSPNTFDFSVLLQKGGAMHNCTFEQLSHLSLISQDCELFNLEFINCNKTIVSDLSAGELSLNGILSKESVSNDYTISNDVDTSLRFVNSNIDLSRTDLGGTLNKRIKGISVNIQLRDSSGPVEGAKFSLNSLAPGNNTNTSFLEISDINGVLPQMIADTQSSAGADPLAVLDHSEYFLQITSFDHSPYVVKMYLGDEIGNGTLEPQTLALREDNLITDTKANAEALSSIDNAEQAYNRWKAESFNSATPLPIISRVDNLLNTFGAAVILDPDANQVFHFDGTSFIFRTAQFSGSITGEVTLNNGAEIVDGNSSTDVRHNISGKLLHLPYLEVG